MRSYFPIILATLLAFACSLGILLCEAFTIGHDLKTQTKFYATRKTQPDEVPQISSSCNRIMFLQTISLGFVSLMNIDIASAAGDESKGSKDDPKFQACLSKCVFECTKPKGEEQRSRSECLPDCKVKCATTKEQLMMGRPLKKGT